MFETSSNCFGKAFQFMTFGESHGPWIGVVIDGIMPGLDIDIKKIQEELDRRKPGQSSVATPRNEPDRAQIISGVFEGKTTGTPICVLIKNQDQKSKDYKSIAKILRPGHASYTYLKKYGIFDYKGGGRASGRETALRVAAGAIAKQFLEKRKIKIIGFTRQIGDIRSNFPYQEVDPITVEKNIVRTTDLETATKMIDLVHQTKKEGDSVGGIVEVVVKNCPAGLGEPIYHKLDADLAAALMTLGAIKGVEFGDGFKAASSKGSENNDAYKKTGNGSIRTKTNHAGGILGGISNGETIVLRIAVKPASSITKSTKTINQEGKEIDFSVMGRHDPCICPRVVPVAEAMVALVLVDHVLLQDRIKKTSKDDLKKTRIEAIDFQMKLLEMQKKILLEND